MLCACVLFPKAITNDADDILQCVVYVRVL